MSPDVEEVYQTAQNLARNCGYAVFPCLENKAPATPHGFQDASKNAANITDTWRWFPGPLIGIATGEVSGIDVLDIDPKHENATAWWHAAAKRIPPTRTYRTRNGGWHVYFQHWPGIRNTAGKLALGVDTRGDGGYIISWFAAGLDCEDHAAPAPWPEWLRDCVLWKPEPATSNARFVAPEHAGRAVEAILRTVTAAPEGQRNAVLYWGACRIAERVKAGQVPRDEAVSLLVAAASSIGLLEVESQRTISSAWKAA